MPLRCGTGSRCLPIADREIEGIDSFVDDDRVTILLRGVFKSERTKRVAPDSGVAASFVVADSVRIARASVGAQSILEVRNEDLTRLQAAIARSLTDREELKDRSHLVAVGMARPVEDDAGEVVAEIPSFDPLENVEVG